MFSKSIILKLEKARFRELSLQENQETMLNVMRLCKHWKNVLELVKVICQPSLLSVLNCVLLLVKSPWLWKRFGVDMQLKTKQFVVHTPLNQLTRQTTKVRKSMKMLSPKSSSSPRMKGVIHASLLPRWDKMVMIVAQKLLHLDLLTLDLTLMSVVFSKHLKRLQEWLLIMMSTSLVHPLWLQGIIPLSQL